MPITIRLQIIIAMILGSLTGIYLPELTSIISPLAKLFLKLLRLIIIPLVFSSLVVGISRTIDSYQQGRLAGKSFGLFAVTSSLAIMVGLILVGVFQPGSYLQLGAQIPANFVQSNTPHISDILIGILPENIINTLAKGHLLPVIFYSFLLGRLLVAVGPKKTALVDVLDHIKDTMIKLSDWTLTIAPIGVFSLMALNASRMSTIIFGTLTEFTLIVIGGLLIHSFLTLPILMLAYGISTKRLFIKTFHALGVSFSTISSAAALPIAMHCLVEFVKIPNRIASFTFPLGTTVNKNGTAMYQAIAAMFIAQIYGIELTLIHGGVIIIMSLFAALGAAAIPSAGLITMAVVLNAINVPVEGIAIILAVDFFLDMLRTTVNTWGNLCVTVIVAKIKGETLSF